MTPLAEVFSVSIKLDEQLFADVSCTVSDDGTLKDNGIQPEQVDEKCSVKLCGTIHFDGGGYEHILYNREAENPELLCLPKNNNTITLVAPSRSLAAMGMAIKFNLRDLNRGGLEVSRGFLTYTLLDPKAHFSKRLTSVVRGQHGCAIVHYMLLPRAVQAFVDVALVTNHVGNDVNGSSPSSSSCAVFGSLVGSYGGHDYSDEYQRKYFRSVLFKEFSKSAVSLKNGNPKVLPLSRRVIAVPKDTPLVIEAELYEKLVEADEMGLVNGRIEFPCQENGTSLNEIQGKNGRLLVNVTWCHYYAKVPESREREFFKGVSG